MLQKVFKAYDVRATYPQPLNESIAWKVGYATARFLEKRAGGPGKVVVSRDHRPSAPSMAEALIGGLRAAGASVVDLGRCDTSVQYYAIPALGAIGGIQTTASHNPIEYIGFKISAEGARPVGRDTGLGDIQTIAETLSGDCPAPAASSTLTTHDIWPAYRQHILSFMGELARPLKVFIDASNGCGTTLIEKVFSNVPNLEVVAINNLYTDQWAHEPNPLVPENMVPTVEGVRAHGADLGACFDGDADRCMLVDDQGAPCGCDHLTAWLADHFLQQQPGSPIIYDLRSSKAVAETVSALGGQPVMSKVGHVNLKAKLRETDGIFGGELSGHFYFKHNNFADSGAITLAAALQVLGRSTTPLAQQIAPFRKYPQSGEINFECDDKEAALAGLKTTYGPGAQVLELDGVSIDRWETDGFWFNVRASNTEPLLRLNLEAKDPATLQKILTELKPRLGHETSGH